MSHLGPQVVQQVVEHGPCEQGIPWCTAEIGRTRDHNKLNKLWPQTPSLDLDLQVWCITSLKDSRFKSQASGHEHKYEHICEPSMNSSEISSRRLDQSSHLPLDQGSLGQWKADQGQVANTSGPQPHRTSLNHWTWLTWLNLGTFEFLFDLFSVTSAIYVMLVIHFVRIHLFLQKALVDHVCMYRIFQRIPFLSIGAAKTSNFSVSSLGPRALCLQLRSPWIDSQFRCWNFDPRVAAIS